MVALGYIGALVFGALCLALSALLYKLGVPKKYTRKVVHILVGFEWAILYHTVGAGFHFVAVCLLFTAALIVSYRKKLMPMISSDSDNAPGTVYYGISMTAMAIASLFLDNFIFAFGIAVFCTSIGDGLAGVLGASFRRFNLRIYKEKTLVGTVSAFVFSALSVFTVSNIYDLGLRWSDTFIIALVSASVELVCGRGLDNIGVPISTSLVSYFVLTFDFAYSYIVPIIVTPYIVAFVTEKRALTSGAVACALILDIFVSFSLGNFGFVLLLAFLVFSIVIDNVKKRIKGDSVNIAQKGDERDAVQVLANGAIPLACALLYIITREFAFVVGYCVALAECFSDTAASGVGVLSKSAFDPFRMKRVRVGISGGMSVLGTSAALIAPFLLLLIALAFGILDLKLYAVCAAFAFLGSVIDSMMGSLIQVKLRCVECGEVTECRIHCGKATEKTGGFSRISNDAVNIISCTAATAIAIVAYLLFIK